MRLQWARGWCWKPVVEVWKWAHVQMKCERNLVERHGNVGSQNTELNGKEQDYFVWCDTIGEWKREWRRCWEKAFTRRFSPG